MRLTVVVPFYERRDLLEALVLSLAAQKSPAECDLIIVDDGSSIPLSVGEIEAWIAWPSKVIRLDEDVPYSLPTARNVGIEVSTADVIMLLDQDLICPPDFLRAHVEAHTIHENIVAFGFRRFIEIPPSVPPRLRTADEAARAPVVRSVSANGFSSDRRIQEMEMFEVHPHPCHLLFGCNLSFRRSVAVRSGLFDPAFEQGFGFEDIEFGARLIDSGATVVALDDGFVFHQENGEYDARFRLLGRKRNLALLYERRPSIESFRRVLASAGVGVEVEAGR